MEKRSTGVKPKVVEWRLLVLLAYIEAIHRVIATITQYFFDKISYIRRRLLKASPITILMSNQHAQ
jgi:hypothetical protein